MINQVVNSLIPCKEKLNPHKFSVPLHLEETITTVAVEKWERGVKSGYALAVERGKNFIRVPVPLTKFLLAAEFLRFLSTEQCWVERYEKKK